MKYKKYLAILIIIIPFIQYFGGIQTFNPLKWRTKEVIIDDYTQFSTNQLEYKNGQFITKGNDPFIIIPVKQRIKNIEVEISNSNEKQFFTQVFYDKGKGLSEKDSVGRNFKNGSNVLVIDDNSRIDYIRLDISTVNGHCFTINKIVLNQNLHNNINGIYIVTFIISAILILLNYVKINNMKVSICYLITSMIFLYFILNLNLFSDRELMRIMIIPFSIVFIIIRIVLESGVNNG